MPTITVATEDGRTRSFELSLDSTVEDVKVLAEVELGVMLPRQQVFHNGKELASPDTLSDAGVADGDLLLVREAAASAETSATSAVIPAPDGATSATLDATPATTSAPATAAPAPTGELPAGALEALSMLPRVAPSLLAVDDGPVPQGLSWSDIPGNLPPDRLHRLVRGNPQLILSLQHSDREMAAAFTDENPATLRTLLMRRELEGFERRRRAAIEAQRLNDNPFDADAQAKIEESIRQRNIADNRMLAMEHVPESFGRVHMLYVPCEVNGTPLKAFVDSGAQSTIMSVACARKCNIMRLVDTSMAGEAHGVGTAKIVGRVHLAQIKIGGVFLNCSFTVLAQDGVDMLFGLDMLRRHQCNINLMDNVLQLEGPTGAIRVPFLSEAQLPNDLMTSAPAPAPPTGTSATVAAPAPAAAAPPVPGAGAGPTSAPAAATPDLFANLPATLMDPAAIAQGLAGAPAAAATATAPAPAPAPAPAAAPSAAMEESITFLIGLGFTRERAANALEMTGGDRQAAAQILFESQ